MPSQSLFERIVRSVVVLAVLAGALLWAAPAGLAATTYPIGNHSVTFYGVRYDYPAAGQSTWYYSVTSGARPSISHVVFGLLCPTIQILDAGKWAGPANMDALYSGQGSPVPGTFPASPLTDPTTGLLGLKFDENFGRGETKFLYFVVNGNYAAGDMTVGIKAGPGNAYGTVPGPSAACNLISSLGDYVWLDANVNGIQDPGETGIANVTVRLYSGTGTHLATTTTNSSGYYLFTGLSAGDYYVVFTLPTGYAFTLQHMGGDSAKDSDADPFTGQTQTVTLGWGQSYLDLDAGMYPTGPTAVTVASFEVLRDNDTLRFKWVTGYEADNLGFDLFAVQPGGSEMILINDTFIPTQGFTTGSEYYYEANRPDIEVGALFWLRAYDTNGTVEDFGPVEAIYSAYVLAPIDIELPKVPAPVEIEEGRPTIKPRSELIVLPDPETPEKPMAAPSMPVIGPELPIPAPVAPRLNGAVRPAPVEDAS